MDNITLYFNDEKLQCLIGAIVSVILIAASVYFLFLQKPMLKGIAYTVIPLSTLLIIICVGVIFRTPKDIKRVTKFQIETPQKIQTEEIPRMEKVMKSFNIIKNVELVLLAIGLVILVVFWKNEQLRGIGIGIIIMSISLYTFDHIAEARGENYIRFLKSL